MEIHAFRLTPGQDLKEEINAFVESNELQAACIITTVGSLSTVSLRFAGKEAKTTLSGDFEILSLTGTVSTHGLHLHIAIADDTGRMHGGHLLEGCIVRTTAEIVIAVLPGLIFRREYDPATGFRELAVLPEKSPREQAIPDAAQPASPPGQARSGAYVLHTDGASKGNPGPAGIGIALFHAEDLQNPVAAFGEYIGETTNNVAEYRALIRGLREALLRGVERVEVRTDSQLMAQQVSGKYKVNAPQIIPLHTEARQLLTRFSSARVVYVPREQNSLADKLANQGVASKE